MASAGPRLPVALERRQFTLDGEPVIDPIAFAVSELSAEEQERFGALEVGEQMLVGGGAGATFTLTRTR